MNEARRKHERVNEAPRKSEGSREKSLISELTHVIIIIEQIE